MMTLEEAIKHAEAAAIENEKEAKRKREHGGWYYDSEARAWAICAEENRQLADWLRELQERREQPEWIPVMDGDGVLPEVDEDGYSDFVLVSFSNVSGLDIGQYREDENGGAFYSGDDDDPYTKIGAFVNAWMPLPKPYREEDLR